MQEVINHVNDVTQSESEYKKEVDNFWNIRRKNRDRLIELINICDLFDEQYKIQKKQAILYDFETNEGESKNDKIYKSIVRGLKEIEERYDILSKLNEDLKNKNKEKLNIEQNLRNRRVDSTDQTTFKIKKTERDKLMQQLQEIDSQINVIKKNIEKLECEIKNLENIFGRNEDNHGETGYEEFVENPGAIFSEEKNKKSKKNYGSPEEYRKDTIYDMRKIHKIKNEILSLLKEGTGIGPVLEREIKENTSDKYSEYYNENQGSLRMKTSRYSRNKMRRKYIEEKEYESIRERKQDFAEMKLRRKNIKKIFNEADYISSSIDIGGIPTFKVEKDGKWSVIRGDQVLCEGANFIKIYGDIGGIPVFITEIYGSWGLFWGDKVLCINVDDIREINDISGIPVCLAKEYGGWSVIRGDQVLCEGADFIGRVRNVGGFPAFDKTKNGKKSVIWGDQTLCEGADNIWHLKDMGGKPAFCAEICGKYSSFWGDKVLCEGADNICESRCFEGKPVFAAKMYGKWNVIWGDKVLYEGADDFGYTDSSGHYDWFENYRIKSIGGKLVFSVKINGMWCVIWGDKILYKGAGKIFDIQDSGGVPVFSVCEECKGGKNWKRSLFYGDQILCEGADRIYTLEGETAVRASKINGKYSFFWKDKIICEGVDDIREIRYHHDKISIDMIGGKPAFEVMINGKYSSFWGDQALCEGADSIGRYRDIGGKPVYCANINGKWNIIWGEDILYEGVDDICEIKDFGGIPTFSVKINGKWRMIWGDKVLYEGADDIGYEDVIVGGKLAFSVKINGKWRVIWGDKVLYEGDNDVGKRIITSGNSPYKIFYIKDIGGKPAFAAEVNGKWNIIWGEDILYKEADNILFLENVGGNPVFKVQKNGEIISYPKTQKEIREHLLSTWEKKEKNRDELLRFLSGLLDNENFNKIQSEILEDFYLNLKKAKTDKEFQVADENYNIIQRITKAYEEKLQEFQIKKAESEEEYEEIIKKMDKIASKAMKLEDGIRWKKLRLKKVKSKWNELEVRQREINNEVGKLKNEKNKLGYELLMRKGEYGTDEIETIEQENISRYVWRESNRIDVNQMIINEKEIDHYEEEYDEFIKNEEENMKNILVEIKNTDSGISDNMKRKVIDTLELVMIKKLELFKLEKIERIASLRLMCKRNKFNLRWKEKQENVGDLLWLLSLYLKNESFEKIKNEILEGFYTNYKIAELDEGIESTDKYGKESKEKHEIEIKDSGNIGKYNGMNLNDLKNQTKLKGYKETYDKIIKDKKEYMGKSIAKIQHSSLGISDELKKKALEMLRINMQIEIEELGKGDKILQKSREIEQWLRSNWDGMRRRLSYINNQILKNDKKIKRLELKRESANKEELTKLFDSEDLLRQKLIDLNEEKNKMIAEINEILRHYDGTSFDISEDIKLTRYNRFMKGKQNSL